MMDGQEYLNQIAAENRLEKQSKVRGILSSKFFLVGAIGLGVLILIMIVGMALGGGGKKDPKSLSIALLLHIDNTKEEIDTFQNDVKSSELRSSSASLGGVLNNTSSKLKAYLEKKYSYKGKNTDKKLEDQAKTEKDALHNELFEAKINGILDRTYAHKMAYEISMMMTEESKILKNAKGQELTDILEESYGSLKNLYDSFNDFSEGS